MAIEQVENYITFPLIENLKEQEQKESVPKEEEISRKEQAAREEEIQKQERAYQESEAETSSQETESTRHIDEYA